jgi:class 3 adenylate cyclase/tetratricopeptide (TPR) repeat protein
MSCPACGTENPAGAHFCMNCGASLERRCPACNTTAPAEARFCMNCGASLEPAAARPPEQPPEERRQVTVLFADLSGYTAFAERMDPEAVKSLVDRALMRLGREVERYGGTVDKFIGDNVMALFGAPVAHEDDAERAVRAGLGMQDSMEEINQDLPSGINFDLRVGINTGEVLAGAVGETYTVMGDTVNVAARLQSAARPGSVTVGERTMRASEGAVRYRTLEPLELKGKAAPVPAWEAVSLTAEQPVGRVAPAHESPLVGRREELAVLESLYERVLEEGTPQLVTLIGEAGVGKSRVLREFERRLAEHPSAPSVRTGRCLPYGTGIVFWALGEVIRAEASIVDSDSADTAWAKLSAYFAELRGEDREGAVRQAALIGRLLGVEVPPALVPQEEDPERARESFFAALRSGIESIARRRPFVIAFEDIHWADDGMLEAIEHLAQWVRAPLLLVCLARDELLDRRPGWGGGRRSATQLLLNPLSDSQARELVQALLPSGREMVPAVAERSGGNPLFAEEMARRIAERGSTEGVQLPDTVQGVLAARLDSLRPFERRLVQQAAVVGRTFWEGSLTSLARAEGQDLRRALGALQQKDILVPTAEARLDGERELAFKHVLIRDVAYGMLPKAVRSRKHFEVGTYFEQRAGDRTDEVVALLADHYGRAAALGREGGVPRDELTTMRRQAVRFLEEAGDAAARLYSNREAAEHYRHARDVALQDGVVDMEEDADGMQTVAVRAGEKLGDVSLRLGRVDEAIAVWEECLAWHRGQEDLERVADLHRKIGAGLSHKGERKPAIEHYQKGINLLKDGPPRLELVRLYEEAAWLYLHTGDNMLAIYASEKALRLAERLGETRAASRAHGIFGRVFGRIGDTEKARQNLERAVELARGSDHGETIIALSALGRQLEISEADVTGAREAYEEALRLAKQMGMLPAQVELHAWLATLAVYSADWESVERSTEASAELAEREGLVGKLCLPYVLRGTLRWREGRLDEATVLFHRALELAEQVGWSELAFQALVGLATALRDQGELDGAVHALDQAIEVCERAGLLAQSIQAMGLRAVVLSLGHRPRAAREAAALTAQMAERLHYPLGMAAALEARGAASEDPVEGAELLAEAEAAWAALDRPLESNRARLLAGQLLLAHDGERGCELLESAAAESERLGVPHLAALARAAAR